MEQSAFQIFALCVLQDTNKFDCVQNYFWKDVFNFRWPVYLANYDIDEIPTYLEECMAFN